MKWTWGQFGIYVTKTDPDPILTDPDLYGTPNRTMILDLLNLDDAPEVDVQFYIPIGRAVVTIDATCHDVGVEVTRRASRQSGWDVDVYTTASFKHLKQWAISQLQTIDGIGIELARTLVDHGYLGLDDLSVIDPGILSALGGFEMQAVDAIIEHVETKAEEMDT